MSPRSYNLLLMAIPHFYPLTAFTDSPVTQLARDVGDVLVQLTRSHEMQQGHGGKGHRISTAPGDVDLQLLRSSVHKNMEIMIAIT